MKACTRRPRSEKAFHTPLSRPEGANKLAELQVDAENRLIEKIGKMTLSDFLAKSKTKERASRLIHELTGLTAISGLPIAVMS